MNVSNIKASNPKTSPVIWPPSMPCTGTAAVVAGWGATLTMMGITSDDVVIIMIVKTDIMVSELVCCCYGDLRQLKNSEG
jgi:hypothetical protein